MRVFVEGGGDHEETLRRCRKGFGTLLGRVLGDRPKPRIVACGSRNDAFRDFCTALERERDALCLLLVDSEGPVRAGATAWRHLAERDRWQRPAAVDDDQAHLMAQCMEAWLLADREALAAFYGQGFRAAALPGDAHVERIPKRDVLRGLEAATRDTRTKGAYSKGAHSFVLLGLIDAERVRRASPFAERLFETLRKAADATS